METARTSIQPSSKASLLEQEARELEEIVSTLREKNDDLNELVKKLSEENDDLNRALFFTRCKYPPFLIGDALGLPSRDVTAIAEELHLFDDERCVLRIPRVDKEEPQNFETTVIFSLFGFVTMLHALEGALANLADSTLFTYIEKNIDAISRIFDPLHEEVEASIIDGHKRFGDLLQRLAK